MITLAMLNFVSAQDIDDTQDIIDKTADNEITQQQQEITKKEVSIDSNVKEETPENDDEVGDGCCTTILQGYNNDSAISFRRDATNKVTLNVKHNSSFIKQYKTGSYFFHVIVDKNGWLVGNGGADNDYVNRNIESNAITMINNNKITTKNMNNIYSLESRLSVGHFVIKAPNGTYSLIIKNTRTYKESGVLKPGQYLVVPNSPNFFKKGSLSNINDEKSMITSSRLLAARDRFGVNRREIVTYYYKNKVYNSTVKVSITNDNGKYVNRYTSGLIDNVQTNNKYLSSASIPVIDKYIEIDQVNFFIKNQSLPIPTRFILNKINTKQWNDSITISGRYIDNKSNNLTYTPLKLMINSVEYAVKTDGSGIFSYTFKANVIGKNNVSVSYPGNRRFAGAEENVSFDVTRIMTKIVVDPISSVQFSDDVVISGRYVDSRGINLTYTPLKLLINSKEYTIKTNKYGTFSYIYKTDMVGRNNISVSYPGNARFEGDNESTSFYVVTKQTKIIINKIIKKGDNFQVTGKYMDITGRNLTFTPLSIKTEDGIKTVKTDAYGEFVYEYKPSNAFNKLVISYPGNKRYAGTSQSIAYTINESTLTFSKSTIMTINNIENVKRSQVVKISGKYIDKDGTELTYTPVNININGKTYTTKTDSKGLFTIDYLAEKVGVINVTASYHGNMGYSGTSVETAFMVLND